MLKSNKFITVILLTLCATPIGHADSTIVYELSNKAGDIVEHTIMIRGMWLRVDSKPKQKTDYTVMDTGRLLKFDIDEKAENYQLTRMGRLYWPESPLNSPRFKPVRKNSTVAGTRCQPVNEIGNDKKPFVEHCMANGGSLKLNDREMITLSRLFMSMRRMSGDNLSDSWLGVATPDERQVSIRSENTAGDKLELKSVSHGRIDSKLLRIPGTYKQLQPELPVDRPELSRPEPETKKAEQAVKQ